MAMAQTNLGSEVVSPADLTFTVDAGADLAAFISGMEAMSTTIDVADITITGSVSGVISLSGGKIQIAKSIATTLTPQCMAFVFWCLKADFPVGTWTIVITYAGTPYGANRKIWGWSLTSATDLADVDDSVVFTQPTTATAWVPTALSCAAGSVQIYVGVSSLNSSAFAPSAAPNFTEVIDKNAGTFRLAGGYYLNAAGGARAWNIQIGGGVTPDTGAMVCVSFKETAPVGAANDPNYGGMNRGLNRGMNRGAL